MEPR